MANSKRYAYSRGDNVHVTFDSEGYIIEAKGFGFIMWCHPDTINKELIGKHIDELAEMIRKYEATPGEYNAFEASVHNDFLREQLA